MSKLIYVDRLKKDILDLQDCYNGFSDTYDKACIIGVIDEQPTVEERKWIPCSERLPEWWWEEDEEVWNAKPVIVCGTDLDYPYSGMAVGLYGPDGWVIEDDNFSAIDTPVAWMPLPEPYAEGRTDDC